MPKGKKAAGRPTLAAADRRGNAIKVMMTKSEQQELERAAVEASTPVSTWIRAAALEKARRGKA